MMRMAKDQSNLSQCSILSIPESGGRRGLESLVAVIDGVPILAICKAPHVPYRTRRYCPRGIELHGLSRLASFGLRIPDVLLFYGRKCVYKADIRTRLMC